MELQEPINGTSQEKTPLERIDELEKQVQELKEDFTSSWHFFQKLFGVTFVKQPDGGMGAMIVPAKGKNTRSGIIADLYIKVTEMWNKHKESKIILPNTKVDLKIK